jgi:hypothetical protein
VAEATALGVTEGTGEEQQHLLRLMEPWGGSADGVREGISEINTL